jgi:hypothetical protein
MVDRHRQRRQPCRDLGGAVGKPLALFADDANLGLNFIAQDRRIVDGIEVGKVEAAGEALGIGVSGPGSPA